MYGASQSINQLDQHDISYVVTNIQKNVPFQLGEEHVRTAISRANSVDRRVMERYGKKQTLDMIIEDLIKIFIRTSRRVLNLHEVQREAIGVNSEETSVNIGTHTRDDGDPILRSEEKVPHIPPTEVINVSNLFGLNSSYNIRSMFNPSANLAHTYLHIDTRYRNLSDDGLLKDFKFNIHEHDNMAQGGISFIGKVRDITSMEIAPFFIPKTNVDDIHDEILFYHKVTLRFHEFDSQGVIAHENRIYHYEFEVQDPGTRFFRLVPLPNTNARFYFRRPITALSTITMSFGTPLQPLIFDKDRIRFTVATGGAGKMVFTTATGEEHFLASGDIVYMSLFNTDDAITDIELIQFMNRNRGHKIDTVAPTTFEIDYGSISAPSGNIIPTSGIILYLGSKRIIFKLRLTYNKALDENED